VAEWRLVAASLNRMIKHFYRLSALQGCGAAASDCEDDGDDEQEESMNPFFLHHIQYKTNKMRVNRFIV